MVLDLDLEYNSDLKSHSKTHYRNTNQSKTMVASDRKESYYPNLFSPGAVPLPIIWTSEMVVRSLRRRLWKAFVDEDRVTALRAYQANFQDFCQWVQEEDDLQRQEQQRQLDSGTQHRKKVSKAKSPR